MRLFHPGVRALVVAALAVSLAACSKGSIGSTDTLSPSGNTSGGGSTSTGGSVPPFNPDGGDGSPTGGSGSGTGTGTGTGSGQTTPPPPAGPVSWGAATAAGHPQTFFDQSRLNALRAARTTAPYAALHAFASAYLDWNANRSDSGAGSDGYYAEVGGYAVLAEIEQKHTDVAVNYLSAMCNSSWLQDFDLGEATELISASIAYDVLYNEPGFSAIEAACKAKIVSAARDLYQGAQGGQWWATDYMNNHNWHDNSAVGIAGQALRGDATYGTEAANWRAQTDADFATVAEAQKLITDGTWHEGIAYGEFGLESQMLYWVGAERAGSTASDDNAFVRNWAHYILQVQMPNHPRTFTMTNGDWVWPRPTTVGMLKYIAHRFADPLAQEAAARWDSEGLPTTYTWLGRYDFTMDWAFDYVTYDPSVPTLSSGVTLPLDNYNDDMGAFVMRSSWESGSGKNGLVVTLKNGYLGGKGNAQRMSSCSIAPGAGLNMGHDHEDDFGLYVYGNGGWLLPEATAYNCCGTGTSSDPDAYQDTVWHNSVTFDGVGQLGDNKISTGTDGVFCGGSSPWFFQRQPTVPVHLSTAHFAIGEADGTHLYPSSVGLSTALRTVVMDRETSAIALTDEFAFASGSHVVQQHFHSMKGSTSSVAAPWVYLDNTIANSGGTVNPSNTALGIEVIAPANVAMSMGIQQSDAYEEWLSPDGAFGHATVATSGPVSSTRFVELLWPTTTSGWATRPSAGSLDAANPQYGFGLPIGTGSESFLFNDTGSTTQAGDLKIVGTTSSDLAAVRNDGSKPTRMMLYAAAGGQLLDTKGARVLIDTGSAGGALEVSFDASGNPDLSGSVNVNGVKFYSPTLPGQVTHAGHTVSWTRDGSTGLITVTSA